MIQYGCSSAFTNKNSKACSIFMKKCSVSTFFTLFPPSGSLCPVLSGGPRSIQGVTKSHEALPGFQSQQTRG